MAPVRLRRVAVALLLVSAMLMPQAMARSTTDSEPDSPRPTPFDEAQAAEAGRQARSGQGRATASGATTAQSLTAANYVTSRVFATQYNPTTPGSVEVAVPDKCVKFAARRDTNNLARFGCSPAYRLDLDYRVVVTRANGQSAVLPANEVGPWNVDDNYWDQPDDVRPRRRFTDLPTGLPESEAAFEQDYNFKPCKNLNGTPSGRSDGADQFDRCVLNPGGLDLSVAAAAQLGIGYLRNEWVTISFLWEPTQNRSESRWEQLGGQLTSGPDVASWAEGRLDTFVRGPDNGLWHQAWDGRAWTAWAGLGGYLTSDPAVVAWAPNRLDVFARGGDYALWHRAWDGSSWSTWESLGGYLTSSPDVASWGPGRLDVVVRGGNNALWHVAWLGASWSGWEELGGALTSSPTAVSWGSNRVDIFVRGVDHALWHKAWNGRSWSLWEQLGGGLTSGPDAASRGLGRLDVVVRSGDNAMWQRTWTGSAWMSWSRVGGQLTSDPTAAAWDANRLDTLVRGPDNALWHKWLEPIY